MCEFKFQIASKIQFRPNYCIQSDVFDKNISENKDEETLGHCICTILHVLTAFFFITDNFHNLYLHVNDKS